MKVYVVVLNQEWYVEYGCAEEADFYDRTDVKAVFVDKEEAKDWIEKHSQEDILGDNSREFHGTFAWEDGDRYSATEGPDDDYACFTYEIIVSELFE
jgi:hypothetical protein